MEFILIHLRAYHWWESDSPDNTETLLIRNNEYSNKNARNLTRMFMEEIMDKDISSPETLQALSEYEVTNDEISIWDKYDNKSNSYRFEIECTYTDVATVPRD